MTDSELRDAAARAVMAAMSPGFLGVDPFVLAEENGASPVNAGHHGYFVGGESESTPGCYSIKSVEDGEITFANPYLTAGSVLYDGPSTFSASESGVLALKIPSKGKSYSCAFGLYESVAELRREQSDPESEYYVIPLYQLAVETDGDGKKAVSVVCDFRTAPIAVAGDFFPNGG